MILFGSELRVLENVLGQTLSVINAEVRRLAGEWVPFSETRTWCNSRFWPRFGKSMMKCKGVLWISGQTSNCDLSLVRLAVLRRIVFLTTGRNIPVVVMSVSSTQRGIIQALGLDWCRPLLSCGLSVLISSQTAETNFVSPLIEKHMSIDALYLVALRQALHDLKNNYISSEVYSQNMEEFEDFFSCINNHFQLLPEGCWHKRMEVVCEEAKEIAAGYWFPLPGTKNVGVSQTQEEHINKWVVLNNEADKQYDRYLEFVKKLG